MRRTYKYRLYPTRQQAAALDAQVNEACRLYNAALDERRSAWRMNGVSIGYLDQANQLKAIRAAGDVGIANFSACQDVLRRVDKTFAAFFRRVKAGEKAGLSALPLALSLRLAHLAVVGRRLRAATLVDGCTCRASAT